MLRRIFLCIALITSITGFSQSGRNWFNLDAHGKQWVDSVMQTLTLEEKLGQLFMVSAYSDSAGQNAAEIACLIKDYHIGGLCFFKGGPYAQTILTRYYQSISKVPLLIALDAEWGLSMRLDSTVSFPKQMAMGTLTQDTLIYAFGKEMARQCKRIGVNVSFSPVLDINNNPLNPIISDRSFGENREKVTHKGLAYAKGLEDFGVMACVKHFPGHGNTESDSHLDLPLISTDIDSLKKTEIYPFQELFQEKVKSVMAAHLYIPALDTTASRASSLSPVVIQGLLRDTMEFGGLIFTDGLNMKGVSKFRFPRQLNLEALLAGNDILLCAEDVPGTMPVLLKAVMDGILPLNKVEEKVYRILASKYWCGLYLKQWPDTLHLYQDLNQGYPAILRQTIAAEALCVVSDDAHLIPPSPEKYRNILSVSIGNGWITPFQQYLKLYIPASTLSIDKYAPDSLFNNYEQICQKADLIIISVQNTSRFLARKYGLTPQEIRFVNRLPKEKTILVHFGNVYALDSFPTFPSVLQCHEDWEYYQMEAAHAIGGVQQVSGFLPVNISGGYRMGSGRAYSVMGGIRHGVPEAVGLNSQTLNGIDSIMNNALKSGATPGGQVLILKDGMAVYHKAFGYTGMADSERVTINHLYDLASMTKVLATTLAVMKLYENKKIKLQDKFSYHVREYRKTPKKNITIAELLTHQAGLPAFVPFQQELMKYPNTICSEKDTHHTFQISEHAWVNKAWRDSIYLYIKNIKVDVPGKYVYSDIGMIMLQQLVERLSGLTLDSFVNRHFYHPMGLNQLSYRPIQIKKCSPSQWDTLFRRDTLRGYVHDPTAALLGGVSGHAGLFSNAWEVGCLYQMLLDSGHYRGHTYFNPATVRTFTSVYFPSNRRGLGFDKPSLSIEQASPCPSLASPFTFGHQGFTGTAAWADPKHRMVCVVLSNRTFPHQENKKWGELSVRTAIFQQALMSTHP